jgi:hypothetical protein
MAGYPWLKTGVPDLSGVQAGPAPSFLNKPGLLDALLGGGNLQGLFSPADQKMARQQGLLQGGLALMAASGRQPITRRRNFGEMLQEGLMAGQGGYQQALQGASNLQGMRAQQMEQEKEAQREQAANQLYEQYRPGIEAGDPKQTAAFMAGLTKLGMDKGLGAWSQVVQAYAGLQPKPEKPGEMIRVDVGDYVELRDASGKLVDRIKKGVDPDTLARERAANWRASLVDRTTGGGAPKPPTAQERTNAGLTMLIKDGIRQVDEITQNPAAQTMAGGVMQKIPLVGRLAQKPIQRQYNDAVGQVTQNAIYLLSGKAVTEPERQVLMNQYGYVPGDDEATLKAKRARMNVLVKAAEMMSGRAAEATPGMGTSPVVPMQPGETPEQYLQRTGVQ